jgi:hypothetical protein
MSVAFRALLMACRASIVESSYSREKILSISFGISLNFSAQNHENWQKKEPDLTSGPEIAYT